MHAHFIISLLVGVQAQRQFVNDYRPGVKSHNTLTSNVTKTNSFFSARASRLVFEDNFDRLDLKTWRHELTLGGGANWEFQQYTNNRTISYTKNGILYIKPGLTSEAIGSEEAVIRGGSIDIWGNMPNNECTSNAYYGCARSSDGEHILNPIQSAQLRSFRSFSMKYGKFEVRAKLPRGDWIWPAIWLLPTDHAYGSWPASGEIDILESRGNAPGNGGTGNNEMASTLHWGTDFFSNQYERTTASYKLPNGQSFADDFHTFTLEWNPSSIITRVDDNIVLNVPISDSFWNMGKFSSRLHNPWDGESKDAPFNQEFNIILNVAIGGTNGYFPEGAGNKPWSNKSPSAAKDFNNAKNQWFSTWPQDEGRALAIDYIRVWSL
ncbi:hypothetical protein DSO57_1025110 [Entomophthora muscae]|uniref:Uncharacterized protein n=2 Tax=Entomophthora muscae TaxID=34485 RepID=A0ACC2UC70_9FUNG|nr:hypothetical protein DSO57_1024423 [Entomophthora muscae]KAJ9084389.1 hypothetical protein DSO57_1025110 [Entomophthora muscae]